MNWLIQLTSGPHIVLRQSIALSTSSTWISHVFIFDALLIVPYLFCYVCHLIQWKLHICRVYIILYDENVKEKTQEICLEEYRLESVFHFYSSLVDIVIYKFVRLIFNYKQRLNKWLRKCKLVITKKGNVFWNLRWISLVVWFVHHHEYIYFDHGTTQRRKRTYFVT